MKPKVTVIWLNYNSTSFLDLVQRSLKSLLQLNYENMRIIVVDNASNDDSFEIIKNFIEGNKPSNIQIKVVRSDMNRGYSGGINLGWIERDSESKYVVFLNNDLIVEPNSLREIIEYMESGENVGVASGLIYFGDGKTVYSAGGIVTELWNARGICWNAPDTDCPGIDKPHYVTYADGAYMVVRVDTIRNVCPGGKPFINEAFLYFDDYILGLLL